MTAARFSSIRLDRAEEAAGLLRERYPGLSVKLLTEREFQVRLKSPAAASPGGSVLPERALRF